MTSFEQVLFVSQADAEAMQPSPKTALISITDPGRPNAILQPGWSAVHRAVFDDIDPVGYPDDYDAMLAISDEQALAIAHFVLATAQTCRTLVVHCRYGVSRSAGIAKAVAQAFGLPFPVAYDEANEFVYRAVRWALLEAGVAGKIEGRSADA